MIDFLLQAWIVITGGAAVWLTSNPHSPHHQRGCWIGLAGQPAWFVTTAQNFQWGVLLLSCIFTASFIRGILHHHVFSKLPGDDNK